MPAIKRLVRNWWVVATAIAVLASVAAWLVCGVLADALRPARWWLILAIWLGYAAAAGWRIWRRRRAAAALAATAGATDGESEAVAGKMKAALAQAKGAGKDALYALPWYVIIGPPGAGKTTLIRKSGLRLVTEDATAGVGGTRNCDWWFADEAVLVDTAGRYTSQDSEQARDARGWEGFLATLRRARPLQPLNGVIVAIGLDEIATAPAAALDRHVVTIRARLAELSRTLGLELPVYVMFTKADLVAGFVEFFDDLSVEGRRSVVGHTLAIDGAADEGALAAGFDAVVQALADRVPQRLQDEGDPIRRGAALTFPPRVADLRARAVRLLAGVGQAGMGYAGARLRGFYLTSGVQQGTPIDRLLGDMARTLGRGTRARGGTPRAFFVNRLLHDVVIAEAGLARGDARRRTRARRAQAAAHAALGVVAVAMAGAWTWSLFANMAGQRATALVAAQAAQAARALDPGDRVSPGAGVAEPLDLLDRLRAQLPYGVARAGDPPLGERFGLYRGDLAAESARAYRDALQRYLLPRLIVMAERALAASAGDPVAVYDPLKVYLMLGNQAGAARDPRYVAGWVEAQLQARELPGEENAATRARVLAHVRALLADPGRFGRQLAGPLLDASLVQAAQATVASLSPAQRALLLMRQQVQGEDWRMVGGALLPGEADAFGNPQEVAAAKVPYLFTRAGFRTGFVANIANIGAALDQDRWMLGASPAAQARLDTGELARLYAADYVAAWNAMLALPQPSDYAGNPTALARLANPQASPLKKIADQVIAQTSGLAPAGMAVPPPPGGALGKAVAGAASGASGLSASQGAARAIEAAFAGLRGYAAGPAAPLGQLLAALGKYQLALAAASVPGGGAAPGGAGGGAAGGGASAQIAAAAAELGVAAANAGAAAPQLGQFVAQVASGSGRRSETQRTSELRDAYRQNVAAACLPVLGAGYPFGTGPDLQPADVARAAGIVDGFAREQLGPYLDRSGAAWAWRAEPTVASFAPAAARAFQRAGEVQAMMNGNLVLRIGAAPTNGSAVRLRAAGVPMDLAPAGQPERLSWSTAGSQVAELIATGDAGVPPLREEGPWALFRLLGRARKAATGPGQYRFSFSPATAIDVGVAGGPDPFAADGPFALRCPAQL